MSLFFFHIRTGGHLDEDTIGVDLPDLDAVRGEAVAAMGDMFRDAALTGKPMVGEAFEVTDEDGRLVLTVPLDGDRTAWSGGTGRAQ